MSCRALGLFLFSFKAPSSGPLLETWNHMLVRLIQITIRIALFNFLFIQRIIKNEPNWQGIKSNWMKILIHTVNFLFTQQLFFCLLIETLKLKKLSIQYVKVPCSIINCYYCQKGTWWSAFEEKAHINVNHFCTIYILTAVF